MTRYTIRKTGNFKTYETPLFTVHAFRMPARPLVVFTNGNEAASVFVERKEVANLLKRKFKNSVDRRIQNA